MPDPTDPAADPTAPGAGGPLRVLLVLGTSTGGVGQHVRSLAAGLAAAGDEVLVAGPAATDELFGFSRLGAGFAAVDVATVPRPAADLRAVRRLRSLVAAHRPHVVHAHGLRAGFLAVLAVRAGLVGLAVRAPGARSARRAAAGSRPRLVVTWHNAVLGGGPRRAVLAGLERLVARGADVTLGASSDLVGRARALGARDARLAPVAAPPLPPPARGRAAVRRELAAGTRPLVVAVGRLAPQKAYPLLLDAAAVWRDRDPPPLVVVAGAGPLREPLQRRIDAERLPVRLLGRRDDVSDLLGAADVAVLTSEWEARALVAQEALRAGVPLVATAVGGVPELVGEAAVLVPYGDRGALAGAVSRLLHDPAERTRLAAAGRARTRSWPDEAATTRRVRSVYREPGGC